MLFKKDVRKKRNGKVFSKEKCIPLNKTQSTSSFVQRYISELNIRFTNQCALKCTLKFDNKGLTLVKSENVPLHALKQDLFQSFLFGFLPGDLVPSSDPPSSLI